MRKIGLRAKFINSSVNIFKLKTLSLPCLHEWKQSSLREVCVCLSSYWEVVIKWRNQRGTHPFPKFKWKHWCIKIRAQTLHHHLKIGIHGRNPAALVTFVGLDFVGPPTTTTTMNNLPPVAMQVYIFHQGEPRDWIELCADLNERLSKLITDMFNMVCARTHIKLWRRTCSTKVGV